MKAGHLRICAKRAPRHPGFASLVEDRQVEAAQRSWSATESISTILPGSDDIRIEASDVCNLIQQPCQTPLKRTSEVPRVDKPSDSTIASGYAGYALNYHESAGSMNLQQLMNEGLAALVLQHRTAVRSVTIV